MKSYFWVLVFMWCCLVSLLGVLVVFAKDTIENIGVGLGIPLLITLTGAIVVIVKKTFGINGNNKPKKQDK